MYNAKCKSQQKEVYTLDDSNCMTFWKRQNYRYRRNISVCQWLRRVAKGRRMNK